MRKEWTDSHFMQCAGYGQMLEQHTNIPIEQLVGLITTATGVCQVFVEDKDSYNNQRVPQLQNLIDEFNKANFY